MNLSFVSIAFLEEAAENDEYSSSPNFSQQKIKRKGQEQLRYHVYKIFVNVAVFSSNTIFIYRLFRAKRNWMSCEIRVPVKTD